MKGPERPCSIKPQQTSSRNVLQRPVEPAAGNSHSENSVLPSAGEPGKLRRVDNPCKVLAWKAELVAGLDAGILDHFRTLGRFLLDDRGKLSRRVADRPEAKFVELLAHLRHRQGLDGFGVQFIQNIRRRAG